MDLHDKFDYFVTMMLKGRKMPLDDVAEPEENEEGDDKPDDSMALEQEQERQDLLKEFEKFTENAKTAKLTTRDQVLLAAGNQPGKSMGTNWLNQLA